jgi:plasmid stabilization system protein ParE
MYWWIAEHEADPQNALRWVEGIEDAIESLREFPSRCAVAPETGFFEREVRQILYHSHRVLFIVQGEDVFVLHVRHVRRLPATPAELGTEED